MKIKEIITQVDLEDESKGTIRMFWVEEKGQEVFGPVENPQLCENFIKESQKESQK